MVVSIAGQRPVIVNSQVTTNPVQITVSAVAPANPQVNDLWLDIS